MEMRVKVGRYEITHWDLRWGPESPWGGAYLSWNVGRYIHFHDFRTAVYSPYWWMGVAGPICIREWKV